MSAYSRENLIGSPEFTQEFAAPTVSELIDKREAEKEQGNWVPACNGLETPFFARNGQKLLYVYQATTGRHAYLDVNTDIILSDEEARAALQLF